MQKNAILAEMAILITGAIAVHRSRGEAWVDIFRHTALRAAMGTLILMMILLTLVDLGAGTIAVTFGGLVVLGYVLAAVGYLGPAVLQLENAALGWAPSAVPAVEQAAKNAPKPVTG